MDDLTAFINARLDEDEAIAEAAANRHWLTDDNIITLHPAHDDDGFMGWPTRADAQHAANHDPARVLREVAAKRKRLALMTEAHAAMNKIIADDTADRADQAMAVGRARAATVAVKYDAAVWPDHPDYKQEWAP